MRRLFLLYTILTIILIGCGGETQVKVVHPRRTEIHESFSEPGKTRLEKDWKITMPIDGRIFRIELEVGDKVTSGRKLVHFDATLLELSHKEAKAVVDELKSEIQVHEYDKLEQTALEESRVAIKAADEALKAAQAQVDAEKARYERASRELVRKIELSRSDAISQSELEDYELAEETALIELRRQQFLRAAMNAILAAYKLGPQFINEWLGRKGLKKEVLVNQLIQARARLEKIEYRLNLVRIVSPINGVVLEKYQQGDASLSAGTPLLLIGNPNNMEVEVEILTQDATRISQGTPVELNASKSGKVYQGRVKLVEPAGFTKLSSLGVEQQRVNAIVEFDSPPDEIGVGYRLQAKFVTDKKKNALVLPRYSILQNAQGEYFVFKVADNALVKQFVEIGLKNDLEMEIEEGIKEGDSVVAAPDASMESGDSVAITEK